MYTSTLTQFIQLGCKGESGLMKILCVSLINEKNSANAYHKQVMYFINSLTSAGLFTTLFIQYECFTEL